MVYFALIWIGNQGPRDPLSNLLPLFIWSIWWIGFVALHMLFGNLWRWINPWTGLYRMLFSGREKAPLHLPASLGVWPAVLLFLLFTSFSIADAAPMDPDRLAGFALAYWMLTFAGMALFGARAWGAQCECFTVFFRILSMLSPVRIGPGLKIGFPGWAVLSRHEPSLSEAIFCLIILGTGSFDGLNETFWWLAQIGVNPLDFQGRSTIVGQTIAGLVGSNMALIAVFALCVWSGAHLAGQGAAFPELFRRLSFSLVPIGLGFHVAHFLTTFLVTAQYALAALFDPLANGVALLGVDGLRVYVGFLRDSDIVRVLWLGQASVVVLSHVIAVIVAHGITRQELPDRRAAQTAEVPLSLFMVLYTLFGLWLLAAARGA